MIGVEVRSPGWMSLRVACRVRNARGVDERDRDLAQPARVSFGTRAGCRVAHDKRRGGGLCMRGDVSCSWRWCRGASNAGVDLTAAIFTAALLVSLAGPLHFRGVGEATAPPGRRHSVAQISAARRARA